MTTDAKPGLKIEPEKLAELSARLREQMLGQSFLAVEAMRDAAAELQRLAEGFAEIKRRATAAQSIAAVIGEGITAEREQAAREQAASQQPVTKH